LITITNTASIKRVASISPLSYVYRSANFDAKFFNFFARLFIYRSPMYVTFRTENKIKFRIKFCRSVNVALRLEVLW